MTAIRGAAAITGAASGIGRALAIELGSRGCDLALADRDEAGLKALAAEIGAARKVSVHRIDVSEPGEIASFAREAIAAHPALGIVVTNADVALMGSFEEIDQAQIGCGQFGKTVGRASRRRRHRDRAQLAHRGRRHRQRPPRAIDRAVRERGEDHAEGRSATHHQAVTESSLPAGSASIDLTNGQPVSDVSEQVSAMSPV